MVQTDNALKLLVALAEALQRYGTPAHRLEEALLRLSERMGWKGQFFSTPTAVFASFTKGDYEKTVLLRINTGDVHLERLSQINAIIENVLANQLNLAEAHDQLKQIMSGQERYGPVTMVLGFMVASACASRFLGGGWREILAGGLIGLFIGLFSLVSLQNRNVGNVFLPISAFIAALISHVFAVLYPPVNPLTSTLAGLIVLVPGLSFTTAMTELATGHMASGTSRLAHAAAMFLLMTFGIALGNQLGVRFMGDVLQTTSVGLSEWSLWIALIIAPINFGILFRASPRDFLWIFISGVLAFYSARVGGSILGPQLGGFFAAFLLGIWSNAFTRLTHKPAAICLEPGIIFLVPGTVGLRSLSALLHNDTLIGVNTAFTMVLVALSLVMGLLFAQVVLSPKRIL